jgi:hypothetical protein
MSTITRSCVAHQLGHLPASPGARVESIERAPTACRSRSLPAATFRQLFQSKQPFGNLWE